MSGIVTDSSGWRTVDDDAAEVARYLETATRLLAVVKRRSIDMLRLSNGASVLDVGCGLGHDAEAILAETGDAGRVVGIDASQELITKAIDRTQLLAHRPEFHVGDALALEFDDNTFDACRIDRVLQHCNCSRSSRGGNGARNAASRPGECSRHGLAHPLGRSRLRCRRDLLSTCQHGGGGSALRFSGALSASWAAGGGDR